MPPDDLKADVWAELRKGNGIVTAYLSMPGYHLDGLCEGTKVYVNPVPSQVETIIHELIHRVRPRWGERRVRSTAQQLLSRMDDREVKRWHRQFQKVTRQQRTVKVED